MRIFAVLTGLVIVLACALRAASPNAISLTGPATSNQPFVIHGVTFGMDKAAVTNLHSQYPIVKPPESPLDVLSYKILSMPEAETKIGLRRPGVMINVVKNIYFNRAGIVVAVEMVFSPLDLDKRQFILESLDKKYEQMPEDRKSFWRYAVNDNVILESTAVELEPQRVVDGMPMPPVYTLKNMYYDKNLFRPALDESHKTFQLYNLL